MMIFLQRKKLVAIIMKLYIWEKKAILRFVKAQYRSFQAYLLEQYNFALWEIYV